MPYRTMGTNEGDHIIRQDGFCHKQSGQNLVVRQLNTRPITGGPVQQRSTKLLNKCPAPERLGRARLLLTAADCRSRISLSEGHKQFHAHRWRKIIGEED